MPLAFKSIQHFKNQIKKKVPGVVNLDLSETQT